MIELPFCAKLVTVHAGDASRSADLVIRRWRISAFDLVICASRYVQSRLTAGLPGIKTAVIHCGVDEPSAPTTARAPRGDWIRMVTVARLIESKGYPYAIEVARELSEMGVDVQWDIIGEGPLRRFLEREKAMHSSRSLKLTLHGALDHDRALEHLAAADVCLLPSRHYPQGSGQGDGIPVALMEAMALGVPVVSTPVCGIPELIDDGVTGILADPTNPRDCAQRIRQLLLDEPRRGAITGAARERIRKDFSARRSLEALRALAKAAIEDAPVLPESGERIREVA